VLANAIEAGQPAMVYTHNCLKYLEEFTKRNIPVVEVLHNAYFWQVGDTNLESARGIHIQRYVAVSKSVKQFAIQKLGIPEIFIHLIRNGLNPVGLVRPPSELRKRLRHCPDSRTPFVIVHPASFGPQKRHILLVRAFETIASRYSNIELVMVGSPEVNLRMHAQVHALVENSPYRSRIHMPGALTRAEMSHLLAKSHMGVLPSAVEGFSIASLEFAYFGLPSVLSDSGAAQEFLEEFNCGTIAQEAAVPLLELSRESVVAASQTATETEIEQLATAIEGIYLNYDVWADNAEKAAQRWKEYSHYRTSQEYAHLIHDVSTMHN
jgi:glycosyltransferase involved in cell wall biosynthesis